MDPKGLAVIDDDTGRVYPALRSVLVVRHGVLVFERYYHGATPATYFNVFSVTKSVTAALVGIALGEQALGGLDQPIGRLLAARPAAPPAPYFNVFSVTKSVTAALVGIALGEQALGGLDQPIGRLLAAHLPPTPHPR